MPLSELVVKTKSDMLRLLLIIIGQLVEEALERGEASAREDWSLFRLLREMNKPETRKGMAAMLEFVKGLGAPKGARALEPGANIVETKE